MSRRRTQMYNYNLADRKQLVNNFASYGIKDGIIISQAFADRLGAEGIETLKKHRGVDITVISNEQYAKLLKFD